LDTLESTRSKREIDVHAMLATGINYRLAKRHNVMVDLTWRVWDDDIENIAGGWNMPEVTETQTDFMVSLGYQFDGSPLFYESYWNRINYRAGAWYRNWYIKDVFEVGGSIGGGFPLGRKGTTIDVAFQGGKRFSDAKSEWEEMFIGLRIGLTGIATWGQERR
jgi:long-chain fatty acid transport protein